MERVAQQTATSLVRRGHDVTVLTRRPTPAPRSLSLEREQVDSVDVMSIAGGDSTFGLYPGHEDELERVFRRMLAEVMPDAVIVSHLLHQSAQDVTIAHAWNVPVVLELHDFYVVCPLAHLQRVSGERCVGPEGGAACAAHCFSHQSDTHARWALRSLEFGTALREADAVIAPSRFVADYFAPLRAPSSPIEVLGNGVGLPGAGVRVPREANEVLHLASVGVVVEHKGPHVVIEALRRAELRSVRYTLLGQVVPDYAQALREAAEDVPGLELRFFGAFTPSQLPMLLADVDLAVVPSVVWETYSIAAREALACGVPVLASELGALPEAIRDGENGLLFAPGDATGLAQLLGELDADRDRVAALAAGIRPSDWITVDNRTDALEVLLRSVTAAGPGPSGPTAALVPIRRALARSR